MGKPILAGSAALAIAAVVLSAVPAYAQPAPAQGGADSGAPMHAPPGHTPPGLPMPRMEMHGGHREHARFGTFALLFRQDDRQLAPADVQKIAEAFLLWHGNHTWKVIDVAPTPDGPIGFAIATPEGSVVARFAMDPHSGRVTRVG